MGDVIWTSAGAEVGLRDNVAVLTLNHPPENALSHVFRAEIAAALKAAMASPAKALVVTGREHHFAAGAGISEPCDGLAPTLRDLIDMLEAFPVPTVAAIDGPALGGGLELALGCRLRLATLRSTIGFPEVTLGLLPGAGGTVRATILCGAVQAAKLIATGQTLTAQDAFALGLVDKVALDDVLAAAVLALRDPGFAAAFSTPVSARRRLAFEPDRYENAAQSLLAKAKGRAMHRCVAAVRCAATEPFDAAMANERTLFAEAWASTESLALRHMVFADQQAAKVDALGAAMVRPLQSIGVIGAGLMGRGIAMACADSGLEVRIREVEQQALDRGLAEIAQFYAGSVAKGRLPASAAQTRVARIAGTLDVAALADCDLIIEAAFEDMTVKKMIFAELDAVLGPQMILATNTSYLDLNQIADSVRRPERVLGLHFFSPANVMKLVEVVRANKTDAATLATGLALSRQMQKIAVVVGVCRGFVGNRMLQARNSQLSQLVLEGARPAQVDAAFRAFGWPMGPFEMQDMAGLDISWRMRKANGLTDPLPDTLCLSERFGQKVGRGWYRYDPGNRSPLPDPEVDQIIVRIAAERGIVPRSVTDEQIIARTHGPLVAEGRKLLTEGIVSRSSDIDVVWVHGYGFPRHLGGPMFWADHGEGRNVPLT